MNFRVGGIYIERDVIIEDASRDRRPSKGNPALGWEEVLPILPRALREVLGESSSKVLTMRRCYRIFSEGDLSTCMLGTGDVTVPVKSCRECEGYDKHAWIWRCYSPGEEHCDSHRSTLTMKQESSKAL